jgi:hypothetical protein
VSISSVAKCSPFADIYPPDLKTISKFAQLEYKLGDPERGKTIFEGIVDSHPKRWDLWSVYMDMEAGQGDIQNLRCVACLYFCHHAIEGLPQKFI